MDAGSKDQTLEIIRERTQCLRKPVFSIYIEPGTIGRSRNFGIRAAKHNTILSTDADCELSNKYVELMVNYLEEYDVVGGTYEVVPETFAEQIFGSRTSMKWSGISDLYVYPSMAIGFRREVFDLVGGYNESLEASEDLDLCLRLRKVEGIRMHFAHDITLKHHVGRGYLTLLRISFRGAERDVTMGLAGIGTPYWKMYLASLIPWVLLASWMTGFFLLTAAIIIGIGAYLTTAFVRIAFRSRSIVLASAGTVTELMARFLQVAGIHCGLVRRTAKLLVPSNRRVRAKLG